MVYLERFNLLAEIGGVSADMDYIANPQRTALELDGRDGEVAVIVSHDADALLRRIRSAGGVGVGLTGVGLTAFFRWCCPKRRLPCLFADCPCFSGRVGHRHLPSDLGRLQCRAFGR